MVPPPLPLRRVRESNAPGRAVPPAFYRVTSLLSPWSCLKAAVPCARAGLRSSAAFQPRCPFTSAGLEPLHFQNTIRQLQGTLLGNRTLGNRSLSPAANAAYLFNICDVSLSTSFLRKYLLNMKRDYRFKRCFTLQGDRRIAFCKQWVINGALQLGGRGVGFVFFKKDWVAGTCKQEPVQAEGHWCFCKWRSLHTMLLMSHHTSSLPMVLSPSSSLSRGSVQTAALPLHGCTSVCLLSASPLSKTITPSGVCLFVLHF